MRKTLISLLTVVGLTAGAVLASPVHAGERQELETNNRKPHEIVREYLYKPGVAKEEFRVNHYFSMDNVTTYYNRLYNFGGKAFIEQYEMGNRLILNKEGAVRMLFSYPSAFSFEGIWYFDPQRDGFNGNEIKEIENTDSAKSIEPEDRKPEEIPVKCNPNEGEGWCI